MHWTMKGLSDKIYTSPQVCSGACTTHAKEGQSSITSEEQKEKDASALEVDDELLHQDMVECQCKCNHFVSTWYNCNMIYNVLQLHNIWPAYIVRIYIS